MRVLPERRQGADLAIDLGTANTRVFARGRGLVLDEPSVLAVRARAIRAFGGAAAKMLGRAPAGTDIVRPLARGAIVDVDAAGLLLREVLAAAGARGLFRPRVLVCVAAGATDEERRAVREAARVAGAREAALVPAPLAAALGCELPVLEPVGSLVVDLGAGRADVAIVSLGGLVVHRSVPEAGDAMDAAIGAWLREEHGLLVGERSTEALKVRAGSAAPLERPAVFRVRGRDLATGQPRELDVTSNDVATAVSGCIAAIRGALLDVLREAPPDLAADVLDRGLILCGGGSLLREIDTVLRGASALPVLRPEQPLRSAVLGAGRLLDEPEAFARLTATSGR